MHGVDRGVRADELAELTCARRAARYVEITGWWQSVEAGEWYGKGYRSHSAWIAAATREPVGACKRILFLGQRLSQMPAVAELFRFGLVSAESARRLACDAGVHRMITHAGSAIVDYGRRTRTVPDPLWRLLVERDRGCRFSGCEVPAEMCDAHHAIHWADHGKTEAHNLVLLCWYHHHVMHEQHFSLEPLGAGHFLLTTPNGTLHEFSPPRLDILTHPGQLSLPRC